MTSWKWGVWLAFSLYWTWLLVSPTPQPEDLPLGEYIQQQRFLFNKSIHVGVYALWTLASGFLPLPVRYRWLLAAFIMGHGTLTECLQYSLREWSHREGQLIDVAFDHVGVFVGLILGWKIWSRSDRVEPTVSNGERPV